MVRPGTSLPPSLADKQFIENITAAILELKLLQLRLAERKRKLARPSAKRLLS